MWIITHVLTGQNILGWEEHDKGFYSHKEAHKFLLQMNRFLKLGSWLYYNSFSCAFLEHYLIIVNKLKCKSNNSYKLRRFHQRQRIYKLANYFTDNRFEYSNIKLTPKGRKSINILCERTSIRTKKDVLKPINLIPERVLTRERATYPIP